MKIERKGDIKDCPGIDLLKLTFIFHDFIIMFSGFIMHFTFLCHLHKYDTFCFPYPVPQASYATYGDCGVLNCIHVRIFHLLNCNCKAFKWLAAALMIKFVKYVEIYYKLWVFWFIWFKFVHQRGTLWGYD